mmetsp:Transcript_14208/g.28343  ORF Transcript_14208/g.28343 Transcript_14208/m.28343 type:complete len:454 (-) Transcript_14208:107-1468(-)|eukprot:CAMPEP_0194327526 /NCGR_PEP_ID=MMETSP0171-20130528/41441_1 /TAXON_ID=218684 /ORGANISM="Corethron pennatum, Strain L29A3" /LENGTH=453 /DNA_ID=CAMNT_0039087503 /DNA_START=75 /DNA_END=1436 /DNA_ORIENTATION=+
MNCAVRIEETNAHALEDKIIELEEDVKSLQKIVVNARKNSRVPNVSDSISVFSLNNDLKNDSVKAKEVQEEVIFSIASVKNEFELEKESLTVEMQTYVHHILSMTQSLDEKSRRMVEVANRDKNLLKLQIDKLQKDLEISKNECQKYRLTAALEHNKDNETTVAFANNSADEDSIEDAFSVHTTNTHFTSNSADEKSIGNVPPVHTTDTQKSNETAHTCSSEKPEKNVKDLAVFCNSTDTKLKNLDEVPSVTKINKLEAHPDEGPSDEETAFDYIDDDGSIDGSIEIISHLGVAVVADDASVRRGDRVAANSLAARRGISFARIQSAREERQGSQIGTRSVSQELRSDVKQPTKPLVEIKKEIQEMDLDFQLKQEDKEGKMTKKISFADLLRKEMDLIVEPKQGSGTFQGSDSIQDMTEKVKPKKGFSAFLWKKNGKAEKKTLNRFGAELIQG